MRRWNVTTTKRHAPQNEPGLSVVAEEPPGESGRGGGLEYEQQCGGPVGLKVAMSFSAIAMGAASSAGAPRCALCGVTSLPVSKLRGFGC